MLFPTEDEYMEWFTKAGFTDVKIKRIGPSWYRGVRRHGLIMGCSVTGVKAEAGESPLKVNQFCCRVRSLHKAIYGLTIVLKGNYCISHVFASVYSA